MYQHQPNETLYRIETFLKLPHFEYPEFVLHAVSHNANLLPAFAYDSRDMNSSSSQEEGEEITTEMKMRGRGLQGESLQQQQQQQNSSKANVGGAGAGGVTIHKPYSFDDKPLLYKLTKRIFSPSLCLFETVFGWKIHITTESEMWGNTRRRLARISCYVINMGK